MRKEFGPDTPLGRRRTGFAEAPQVEADLEEALIEREPITVVCSEKGWIRSLKGHISDASALTYKEGDREKFVLHAQTTDKLVLLSSSGRFFTLDANRLPGGRGPGEPVRLSADIDAADGILALFIHDPDAELLVAASDGNGFIVAEADCVANTRKGKQVLNVRTPVEAQVCARLPAGADHVAVVGENRKMLIFPLTELPKMARGRGVRLQRYRDGGLSDARAFALAEGLDWIDSSGRTWTVTELKEWIGQRAAAGRQPPKGFPRNNRFG